MSYGSSWALFDGLKEFINIEIERPKFSNNLDQSSAVIEFMGL
eukprot:CAMPEP_0170547338 /NCGR_PEP_ID=MMETSP0211-20121228/5726_1 /TAXON_ID=311385 /ORGANISM="Pseudokeronopsis sp., Strain OXSARD2" /LENGTH=42 /DNA_ID= /DNA_START= /DNA_END= /DNA_ORIENTATION=